MRLRTAVLAACVMAVFGFWGITGTAQGTVAVNPTLVQFTPSADHSVLNLDGTPIVSRYDMRVYVPTALTVVVFTQSLGKPAPGTDGTIQVDLGNSAVAALLKNTQYVAEVVAIGPYGEGVSAPSNPFGFAAPPRPAGAPVLR
jgi:hypothetical protein